MPTPPAGAIIVDELTRFTVEEVISGITLTIGGAGSTGFFGGFSSSDASILFFSRSNEGLSSDRLAEIPSSGSLSERFRVIAGSVP